MGKVRRNCRSLSGLCNCRLSVWNIAVRASENWKRSEFVPAQIKEFNSDKINNAVLQMMDYDPAHVELYPEKSTANERYVDVTLSMLVKAVGQETEFTDAEFRIRIFFEHYLNVTVTLQLFFDRWRD